MARLCVDNHASRIGIQRLLDTTTDGFCAVERSTGVIITSSDRLCETLGERGLPGKQMKSWAQGDDQERLAELLQIFGDKDSVPPLLVTCINGDKAFDARVIQYSNSGPFVYVCVQVQGEIRTAQAHQVASGEVAVLPTIEDKQMRTTVPCSESSLAFSITQATSVPSGAAFHAIAAKTECGAQTDVSTQTTITAREDVSESVNFGRPPLLPREPRIVSESPSSSGSQRSSLAGSSNAKSARRQRSRDSSQASSAGSQRPSQGCSARSLQDDVDQVPALLGQFEITPAQTASLSLARVLKHWNTPRAATCCPFHAQRELAIKLLKAVKQKPCNGLWSPSTGWQCSNCLGTNASQRSACYICEAAR